MEGLSVDTTGGPYRWRGSRRPVRISVSLSANGERVAIGGIFNDGNGETDDASGNLLFNGHVRVYEWKDSAWIQVGADLDGEVKDRLGSSVSLSGDGKRVAIGAPFNDGNDSAHVRVYDWNGIAWIPLDIDPVGESLMVSLSGDGKRVAVGAPNNDSGQVRVYQLPEPHCWTQLGDDLDGEAAYDHSGWSVSLSGDGDIVAIGAPWNDGNGTDSGHVRVYHMDGTTWSQLGDDMDGEAGGDESGMSVSLSADGRNSSDWCPL